MDDQTNDRDPDTQPGISANDLEEALKWLGELTARQGAPQDAAQQSSPVVQSPFHGLIESQEGDLPDWLREAPSAAAGVGFEEVEVESRLDWLAKMAQRESIEELPTLEWRHLSDPVQKVLRLDKSEELTSQPDQEGLQDIAESEAEDGLVEEFISETPEETFESADTGIEIGAESILVTEIAQTTRALQAEEIDVQAEGTGEELEESTTAAEIISADIPTEELPSPDDLDAAMAWIEELAASQGAPVEDVPSVADRALASRLMIEVGLSPESVNLDSLGANMALGDLSLMEGQTPTSSFVEAEDFADTIVLVETMAADQGILPDEAGPIPDEPVFDDEPAPDNQTFHEAMAFLDDLAAAETPEPEVDAIDPSILAADEPMADLPARGDIDFDSPHDDSIEPEQAPWLLAAAGTATIMAMSADTPDAGTESTGSQAASMAQLERVNGYSPLEETLRLLDGLALPTGKTLDDIDLSIRKDGPLSPRSDLDSALNWLESALNPTRPAQMDLVEPDILDQMPEDPDAVLAWLEQMAADDSPSSSGLFSQPAAESAVRVAADEPPVGLTAMAARNVEELVAADLLDMPEDPDEAMLWLEGLAAGTVVQPEPDVSKPQETVGLVPEEQPARSRRRRGRKAPVKPEIEEPESTPASGIVSSSIGEPDVVEVMPTITTIEQPVAVEPELVVEPETPKPATPAKPRRRAPKPKMVEEPSVLVVEAESEHSSDKKPDLDTQPEVIVNADPLDVPSEKTNETAPVTSPAASSPTTAATTWIDLLKPLK